MLEPEKQSVALTGALEDYLETIYQLIRDKKIARIKDIARARKVKAGSVSPAMRRLSDLGYIDYGRREFITLTPKGEEAARRVYARHVVLTRFFAEILQMPASAAEIDACAMEHNLSNEAMDRLVRLFEYLHHCADGAELLDKFHGSTFMQKTASSQRGCIEVARSKRGAAMQDRSLADLQPGQHGVVTQVQGRGAIRQRLLDMGILPDISVEVERVAPSGDPVWVKVQGFQLSLRKKEAKTVMIEMK